ncbi:MAG: hypothetical protein U9N78_06535 [Actinomycetota bacterium]|nr:hypothetical protein [Actinomycetota bacterium]
MAARRFTPGRSALLVALSLLLVVGMLLVVRGVSMRITKSFCTADGLLVDDVPSGWDLRRDGANGCEWTLFNRWGSRAPDELYDGLSIEAPPTMWATPGDTLIAGLLVSLGSVAGIVVVVVVWRRRGTRVEGC